VFYVFLVSSDSVYYVNGVELIQSSNSLLYGTRHVFPLFKKPVKGSYPELD